MTPRTIERLQYFVGKVCTIITTQMNRQFDEQIAREHFAVRIREINIDGIWGLHPYNPALVSYFAFPQIISIHEEIELNPDNPQHARMIEEYEEKTGKKLEGDLLQTTSTTPPPAEEGVFVDIDSLEHLAEQTKRSLQKL